MTVNDKIVLQKLINKELNRLASKEDLRGYEVIHQFQLNKAYDSLEGIELTK